MKTWTAADLAVKKTGPAAASVGATLTYRIDVSNPGDLPAKDVVATDAVPDGLTYLGSNPPAETAGRQLQWRLGELGARQRRTIEVHFRAEKQGSVANCCEATAAGGLKVSDCATTTVTSPTAPSLDVRITGPAQANVGSHATFEITVANRSPDAARRSCRSRFVSIRAWSTRRPRKRMPSSDRWVIWPPARCERLTSPSAWRSRADCARPLKSPDRESRLPRPKATSWLSAKPLRRGRALQRRCR